MLSTLDQTVNYTNVPDDVFMEMLYRAFQGTDKLDHFLNDKDKIAFLRHYTHLMDRLSYVRLQLQQWNYYYHIGKTQTIWLMETSQSFTDNNSQSSIYHRSKTMIKQHVKQFEKQLEETQNIIEQYEKEIVLKAGGQYKDYSSDLIALFLIINTFVSKHQQKLRDELEYKRHLLILNGNDYQLIKKFFDLKPTRSQVRI